MIAEATAVRQPLLDPRQVQADVATAVAAGAQACHLDIVACECKAVGGDFRILVLADRYPGRGGIALDDCATLSLAVQAHLDAIAGFADRYEIEVSSPGIDRPLRHLDDCARFTDVDVRVTYSDDGGQLQSAVATLVAVDVTVQTITLRAGAPKGKSPQAPVTIAWSHVQSAQLAPTLAQWQAMGARLAAETPHVALDQTGGTAADANRQDHECDLNHEPRD